MFGKFLQLETVFKLKMHNEVFGDQPPPRHSLELITLPQILLLDLRGPLCCREEQKGKG